jgi:hypothetical protein
MSAIIAILRDLPIQRAPTYYGTPANQSGRPTTILMKWPDIPAGWKAYNYFDEVA